MLLTGATLADGVQVDVALAGDRIASVRRTVQARVAGSEPTLDLSGYVLLPAFAEPHAHLDKAFSAADVSSVDGTLPGAIAAWRRYRRLLDVEAIAERARAAALAALAHGVTAIRTHTDVAEGIGLRAVEALVQVRDELSALVDIQVVAFSHPLSGPEGATNRQLMERAVAIGADAIGGAPHLDPDPHESLDYCLRLADSAGLPVDLHMDENLGDRLDLSELARRVSAGVAVPVTASHCVSLGMAPPLVQEEVATAVAQAGISIVTLPMTNLYLQGRAVGTATPRGLTAIRALLSAGVTLAAGEDNVQDPFNPLGRADPLGTAQLLVLAAHLDPSTGVELVGAGARAVLGLPAVQIHAGAPADLVAIAGRSLREVVATATEDRAVIRCGRVVSRTRVQREAPTLP